MSVDWSKKMEPGAVRVEYGEIRRPEPIKEGDIITIQGAHHLVPNPDRKWYQFWKPRRILGPLQRFRVLAVNDGGVMAWGPDPRPRIVPDIIV